MVTENKKTRVWLFTAIGFLLFGIAIEFVSILWLNSGLFVYTLDDAYIHMALAENIRNWHYGINISEFSAPSSSILWPLIIMPFANYECAPLIINVAAALATVFLIVKILSASICLDDNRINNIIISTGAIFLILATNIIGLPFTGMEHSLQVLIVVLIAYGMIVEVEEKTEVSWWFLAAIIVAPLIRYECLAISIAAIAYLLLRGYLKQAGVVMALIAIFLGAFSAFLISIGLDIFPTSVIAKSSVVESGGALQCVIANIRSSLYDAPQGRIMSFGSLLLLAYILFTQDKRRKHLAISTIIAIFMHFIAGHYGWYHRYEIYILAFVLLITIYIYGPTLKKFIERKKTYFAMAIVAAGFTFLIGIPYIHGLFSLPFASNNIYEQHYQMHRFAVDYYNKPVAVNDLGYVSYKNDNYVLDLWGLGSKKALLLNRVKGNNSDWMKNICDESNIGLVMIYQEWFEYIPNQWVKIGKLCLGKQKITSAFSEVYFYATNKEEFSDIVVNLNQFTKTLPTGVEFVYEESNSQHGDTLAKPQRSIADGELGP